MKIESTNISEKLGKTDLFIMSSGFEKRCLILAQKIDVKSVNKAIIFQMLDSYKESESHKEILAGLFPNHEIVTYEKNEQYPTYVTFLDKLTEIIQTTLQVNKLKIVLDCTGFSRDILLILLKVLHNNAIKNNIQLTISHTPAEKYDEWLTKGVRRISPIVGYSGLVTPSKKLLLVVLNGFENERTETIIGSIEPNALILGQPSKKGSINNDLSRISFQKYNSIKDKFQSILKREFEFSCTDLSETIGAIEAIYQEFKEEFNISVTPLNNKISTLAVAIAAIKNDNIQVCYASANQYNIEKELTPSDYFLVYEIDSTL